VELGAHNRKSQGCLEEMMGRNMDVNDYSGEERK